MPSRSANQPLVGSCMRIHASTLNPASRLIFICNSILLSGRIVRIIDVCTIRAAHAMHRLATSRELSRREKKNEDVMEGMRKYDRSFSNLKVDRRQSNETYLMILDGLSNL